MPAKMIKMRKRYNLLCLSFINFLSCFKNQSKRFYKSFYMIKANFLSMVPIDHLLAHVLLVLQLLISNPNLELDLFPVNAH